MEAGIASRQERQEDLDRRLTAIEGSISSMGTKLDALTVATQSHVFRATCINGSAKVLQGASAGGGVIGAAIAIVWALKQLGLI